MNKFFSSQNIDETQISKNIVSMGKNEAIKNDILSLEDGTSYKISLHLINGNGSISLDNKGTNLYNLNYESQPEISIFIKLDTYSISSRNNDPKNNFTFFINATKIDENGDIEEKMDRQKNYKIGYLRYMNNTNKNSLSRLVPICLKILANNQQNKILFVNYRFIEIIKGSKRDDIYETTKEMFIMNTTDNKVKMIDHQYYPEYQRGFAAFELPEKENLEYINLIIDKNLTNPSLYNQIFLEITPLFMGKVNNEDKFTEEIYIPKNTYIQLDLNISVNLIFTEQNIEYNNFIIDIGNTSEINITNKEDFNCSNSNGKMICFPYDKGKEEIKTKYQMRLLPNHGTIFVKYTTTKKNDEHPRFSIHNDSFDSDISKGEGENSYFVDLEIIKKSNSLSNFKIVYFIRVYDFLDFFEDKDINNILIKRNAIVSFRKELNEEELSLNRIKIDVTFGNLKKQQFYINVIGAAYHYDNVEYFAYHSNTFRLSQIEENNFNENWIIPLVIIILIFIASVTYIIINFIQKRKQKKQKIQDMMINDVSTE